MIVKLFLIEGAIPLVKGNVSYGLFSLNTKNEIFGEALNPYSQSRSCGGSSGGDAGLVASKCIPFSVCEDLIFSAAFCGIYGFKPTMGRVTSRGIGSARKNRFDPFTHLPPSPGSLGTTVKDCILGF